MASLKVIEPVQARHGDDVFAWSRAQAALVYERRVDLVDWDLIGEELKDLGASLFGEVEGRLATIIQHLLKLEMSPAVDPRRGWRATVRESRVQIDRILRRNPSLAREIDGMLDWAHEAGGKLASGDLADYGEGDGAVATAIAARRFTAEELLGDWLPKEGARDSLVKDIAGEIA